MNKIKVENYPMVSPTPIVLVGADIGGKANFAAVGAYGVVCLQPVLYVSLKNTHHTTAGVKETGYFSVNIPAASMMAQTDYCGMVSGKNADKSKLFSAFYDDAGRAPLIAQCPMNFLCKVMTSTPVCGFEAFFGEIVAAYADETCVKDGKPDPNAIHPLLSMGMNYFELGPQIGFPFQAGRELLPR